MTTRRIRQAAQEKLAWPKEGECKHFHKEDDESFYKGTQPKNAASKLSANNTVVCCLHSRLAYISLFFLLFFSSALLFYPFFALAGVFVRQCAPVVSLEAVCSLEEAKNF